MTKQQLAEIISKAVKQEVQRQMMNLKVQLLAELKAGPMVNGNVISKAVKPYNNGLLESKSQLSEADIQKQFRSKFQSQNTRQKVQYSSDPMLNSLLSSTQPIIENVGPSAGYDDNDPIDIINVPTMDADGNRIRDLNNPKLSPVLEAMNRDYSGMFKEPNKPKTKVQPQNTNNLDIQSFRSSVMSKMLDEDAPMTGGYDDEDFSFLDNVQ